MFDGQTQRNGTKKPKRLGMGLIAFGSVFFGLAVLFLVQAQYNPDPLAKRSITSAAWWISTIEENAFRRLAVVSGDFNDIYVSPDAKLVVAVGNGGLVLRSDDGGLSWTKSVISNQAPPQNATNPRMERLRSKQSQAEARSKNLNAEIEKLNTLEGEQFKRYQELLKSAKSALKSKKGGDGKSRQLMRDAERELERSVRTAAKSRDLEDQQVRLWGQMNDRAKEIAALLASDTDIAAALAKPAAAANLRGIDFTGGIGWAVGDAGVVLKSTDGGRNWSRTGPLSADDFVAVAFTSDGTNGGIMRANDVAYRFGRDRVWRQGDEPLSYTGLRLRFRNFTVYGYGHENQVWLLSKDGLPSLVHAFSTLDLIDGKREPPQASAGQTESKSGLIALEVGQAGQKIWAVGENGKGRRTDVQENFDLSSTPPVWTDFDTGLTADLAAVRFGEDGLTGWVVGKNGALGQSVNGGQTWRKASMPPFRKGQDFGWRLTSDKEVEVTTSGPDGFARLNSYRHRSWPSPISILFFAGALILFVAGYLVDRRSLKKYSSTKIVNPSDVSNSLSSDRPLRYGDPDLLGFGKLALTISRFLRNDATEAPLTLAINGEWGSGKSSIMNLLNFDLRRHGWRAVWFNAWHNQKEERLLAALLQAIRRQAVPSPWTPVGLWVRIKLAALRIWGRRREVLVLGLAAVCAAAFGIQLSGNASTFVAEYLKGDIGFYGGSVSTLAAFYYLMRNRFAAMALSPGKLFATRSAPVSVAGADKQLKYREEFAAEFGRIAKVLSTPANVFPSPLIVFVDDLDRCQPDNVLDILEAVNFLVSSGECYVVLGIDRQRVEDLVQNHVKNKKFSEEPTFARDYMEKLINIDAHVPDVEPERLQADVEPRAWKLAARIRGAAWWQSRVFAVALYILVFSVGGYAGWDELKRQSGEIIQTAALMLKIDMSATFTSAVAEKKPETGSSNGNPEPPAKTAGQEGGGNQRDDRGGTSEVVFAPAASTAGFLSGQNPIYIWLVSAFGISLLMFQARAIAQEDITRDTNDFQQALVIWEPVVTLRRNTPRNIKRFRNWARFLAMGSSPVKRGADEKWLLGRWRTEQNELIEKAVRELGLPNNPTGGVQQGSETIDLHPQTIVALAALYQCDPQLLNSSEEDVFQPDLACVKEFADVGMALGKSPNPLTEESQRVVDRLEAALDAHQKRFGKMPTIAERDAFLQSMKGVRFSAEGEEPSQVKENVAREPEPETATA